MEETNLQPEQNKMGTMSVPKLLLNMGAPMMLSMLGQALYNVVDTYFVSHISGMGDQAINALTLAYPIQMLIIALGVGTGVGVNAMLAQSLGRKDREQASRIAGNAVLISLGYFAIIFVFGLTAAKGFIESQTKETIIATMGTTYLRIVTVFSLGTIGFMCLEKIVMATGNTRATMVGQLAGAITNIVLDPILIYGYMGCPQMGVAGAAWATVIGQFISLFILAWIHFRNSKEIDNSVNYLRPCKKCTEGDFFYRLSFHCDADISTCNVLQYEFDPWDNLRLSRDSLWSVL